MSDLEPHVRSTQLKFSVTSVLSSFCSCFLPFTVRRIYAGSTLSPITITWSHEIGLIINTLVIIMCIRWLCKIILAIQLVCVATRVPGNNKYREIDKGQILDKTRKF